MKIKQVRELLNKMNRNNKDYFFVLMMLGLGEMGALVSPKQVDRLKELMDKKKIDYKPKFWEWDRYVRLLKFWWYMRAGKKTDYSGISRTTYTK